MLIRVGARGSQLSLKQTNLYLDVLKEKYPDTEIELVILKTKGDKIQNKTLAEIGGKGLFVGEFEEALKSHVIDVAIHSAKDLPALSEECFSFATLPRGDVEDVLLVNDDVKEIKVIGTSSPRRQMMIHKLYPDAEYKMIRGNINTRIEKLQNHDYDAIILAKAGIERLKPNLDGVRMIEMNPHTFTPSACQGILTAQTLKGSVVSKMFESINDEETKETFDIERRLMHLLDATCYDTIAAYSYKEDNKRYIEAFYHNDVIKKTLYTGDESLNEFVRVLKEK